MNSGRAIGELPSLAELMDGLTQPPSPFVSSASDGSYPIARPLFMYTNGEPEGAIKDYLDWVKSDEGQCIIFGKGYAPYKAVNCN